MTSEDLLRAVADPRCFPHGPAAVQVIQTHLSIVCLVGDRVYKLKKAVTLPFVDFGPLANRRQACRDEVRLNRRLCPDVYLGTAALRPGADGRLVFADVGDDAGPDDLDVAVVMKRLPQDRMLDELLRTGAVDPAAIAALARQIAAFHGRTERVPTVRAHQLIEQLQRFAAENFESLRTLGAGMLSAPLLAALAATQARYLDRMLPTLRSRAGRGLCVDGHGDLHARNICMTSPPTIYDCIEFEPAFRCGDVALEVAFLVMDLRYRAAGELASLFAAEYATARSDHELPSLLPTLASYRAVVRGKVAAMAAAEPELAAADRTGARASSGRHLRLAAALQIEAGPSLWLVLCGPPASGKSSLADALATLPQWPVLATDRIRKQLAGLGPTERGRPEHYTPDFHRRTYAELLAAATRATQQGRPVVLLDGNFPTPAARQEAAAAATAAGATCRVVHVAIDAETAVARAAARATGERVSDADSTVAARRHGEFVAPTADEALVCLSVDGREGTEALVDPVLAGLLASAAAG